MKTSLGKVATVATAVLAIAVGAASTAVLLGGPNWLGQANEIEGYSFSYVGGENPQWTATNDADGQAVRSAKALPDVIPPALDQKIQSINDKADQLSKKRDVLTKRVEMAEVTSKRDVGGLEVRIAELRAEINELNKKTSEASVEVLRVTEEIAEVESKIEDRRGDVQRMSAKLGLVEADIFRARQLRQQLADLITQIDADLATAERREEQLKSMLGVAG